MVSAKKKERFQGGPENETWNKLKGKRVRVSAVGHPGGFSGTLVWVDVYTIGLLIRDQQEVPTIIYKGPGIMIAGYDA